MTPQEYLRYIRNPDLLEEVPMERLLSDLLQHPYSANLKLLVLLKARQTADPGLSYYLERYAGATFDRAHLHSMLHPPAEPLPAEHEKLELKDLDELELVSLAQQAADPEPPGNTVASPPPAVAAPPPPEEPLTVRPFTAPRRVVRPRIEYGKWVAFAAAYQAIIPQRRPERLLPEDPARFRTTLPPPQESLAERLRRLRPNQGQDGDSLSAADGGVGPRVVVSETLAALLVRQEQYREAIKMYRRLGLLYPQKKAIFAGLIQELKEKL